MMLRKSVSLMLTLMLLPLSAAPALAAWTGPVNVFEPGEEDGFGIGVSGIALLDGRLWINASDGLYALDAGATAPTLVVDRQAWMASATAEDGMLQYFDTLLSDEEGLYAYVSEKGTLYPLSVGEGKYAFGEPVVFDLKDKGQDYGDGMVYIQPPEQMLLSDGRVYMVFRDHVSMTGELQLLSFDKATGEKKTYDSRNIQCISAYKEGKLLAIVMDEMDMWDPATGSMRSPVLCVFDPAADQLTELGPVSYPYRGSDMAVAYDAALDMIYMLAPNRIIRRDAQGKEETCAYLPVASFWGPPSGRLIVPAPGICAVATSENVFVRQADPAQLPTTTLAVYGGQDSETHRKAAAKIGDVPVLNMDSQFYSTAQEMGQALVSGENAIDIYFLETPYMDIGNLMDKGYCHDLSGSEALTAYLAETYPMIQEACSRNGQMLLVPVGADIGIAYSYPAQFEQVGVSPPETFEDLCHLIGTWDETYAEEYPDIIPMAEPAYQTALFTYALQLHIALSAFENREFKFDDPVFRNMVRLIDETDSSALDIDIDWSDPSSQSAISGLYEKKALISLYGGGGNLEYIYSDDQPMGEWSQAPLVLKAEADKPAVVPVMLRVAAVNPRSANIDIAVRYLENYIASLPQGVKAAMCPDMNDPIENEHFAENMEDIQRSIDEFEQAAQKAEGAEKTQLGHDIELMQQYREELQKSRFRVNAESIQHYRDMMKNAYVATDMMNILPREVGMLLQRYMEKQITLDQFIHEADAKIRLMRLENQ